MKLSKKRKPKLRGSARPARVRRSNGTSQPISAHWYENAKSIDVYIWVRNPKGHGSVCASARIHRALLADYVRRTK